MVRCRWTCVLELLIVALCTFCVILWWRAPLLAETEKSQYGGIQNIILTKENAPFFVVTDSWRPNPKILAGMRKEENGFGGRYDANATFDLPEKQQQGDDSMIERDEGNDNEVNYNVHVFYYAWYGNPGQDGKYLHWDHEYLPHWDKKISAKFPTGQAHIPPDDIGSSFYPLLGPYSSLDEVVTRTHMMQIQQAGIGVLSLSWYPPGMADDQGRPMEQYIPVIFDIADQYGIKVCFHIEPYKNRTPQSVRDDLKYIKDRYSDHPAFYRYKLPSGETRPLFYIYDSYLISADNWRALLTKSGDVSIRETELDAVMIGLLVERKHMQSLASGGFDGFYTYFAADKFSYGSTRDYWHDIASSAKLQNLMFIPSVGPGYDDLKVRPWNDKNTKERQKGAYYEYGWDKAITSPGVSIVSITSFNEWHEGTQIEPASRLAKRGNFRYLTYEPHDPEHYLSLTKKWTNRFSKQREIG